MKILINTSLGELIDKLTILEIKRQNIRNSAKLKNVTKEWSVLNETLQNLGFSASEIDNYYQELKKINQELWDIEDCLREKEREQSFDNEFTQLARSVYFTNDKRATIKKEINLKFGSELIEEKFYKKY